MKERNFHSNHVLEKRLVDRDGDRTQALLTIALVGRLVVNGVHVDRLLKTNDVWLFVRDDFNDPLEAITTIPAADAFMNVIS